MKKQPMVQPNTIVRIICRIGVSRSRVNSDPQQTVERGCARIVGSSEQPGADALKDGDAVGSRVRITAAACLVASGLLAGGASASMALADPVSSDDAGDKHTNDSVGNGSAERPNPISMRKRRRPLADGKGGTAGYRSRPSPESRQRQQRRRQRQRQQRQRPQRPRRQRPRRQRPRRQRPRRQRPRRQRPRRQRQRRQRRTATTATAATATATNGHGEQRRGRPDRPRQLQRGEQGRLLARLAVVAVACRPASGTWRRWRWRWRPPRGAVRPSPHSAANAASAGADAADNRTGRTIRHRSRARCGRCGRGVPDPADHAAGHRRTSHGSWRRRRVARLAGVAGRTSWRDRTATGGSRAAACQRGQQRRRSGVLIPDRLHGLFARRRVVPGRGLGSARSCGHACTHRRRRIGWISPGKGGPCGPHKRHRTVCELTNLPALGVDSA